MPSLFLSHSHQDKWFARRLAQDLIARGVRVWLDEAEMRAGDSLIAKIGEGIATVDFLGVILSPASVQSRWVTHELEVALHSEIESGRPRLVPILYAACEIPRFLRPRKYVDFSDQSQYRSALRILLDALLPTPPYTYLTAREAVRLVNRQGRPKGYLFGLSQQGNTQQYIDMLVMREGDWFIADAKTGRSVIWITDFYSPQERLISSYGVFNGKISDFPPINNLGDEPKIANFNFIDSDLAIAVALAKATTCGLIPDPEAFFINTRMRHYNSCDFIWSIFFMDTALRHSFFTVSLDARTGSVLSAETKGP